jgi:hypothetical protein
MECWPINNAFEHPIEYNFNRKSLSTIFQLYIGVSHLLVEETEVPGENNRLAKCHWQTFSHDVVSRTLVWEGFELTTLVVLVSCYINSVSRFSINKVFLILGLFAYFLYTFVFDPRVTITQYQNHCKAWCSKALLIGQHSILHSTVMSYTIRVRVSVFRHFQQYFNYILVSHIYWWRKPK